MSKEKRQSRHKNSPFEDAIENIGRKTISIISTKANTLAPKIARKISALERIISRHQKRH